MRKWHVEFDIEIKKYVETVDGEAEVEIPAKAVDRFENALKVELEDLRSMDFDLDIEMSNILVDPEVTETPTEMLERAARAARERRNQLMPPRIGKLPDRSWEELEEDARTRWITAMVAVREEMGLDENWRTR